MKLKFEKNMRILTDLMGYCYYLGGADFHADMNMDAAATHITLTTTVPGLAPDVLEDLSAVLNTPRQRDMEQNYWNVSGGEELDGELLLAGLMVDSATVTYEGDTLTIAAERIHLTSLE